MIPSSVPAALASGSSRSRHTRWTSAASSSRSSRSGAPGWSSRASVWRRPAAFRPPIAPGPEPIRVSDRIRPVRQQRGAAGDQAAHRVAHQVHAAGLRSLPAWLTESAMASTSAAS